ncbi:MarR family winged helix-turn-helix transcriptional regulator [Methyloligella solikamskensis]|uniref:MarR family winged helix-turn-helix transcriptional regulator n=1 Tax=Methyloligella solikamskensis TaxID=1177756 RepID=A0ABW3J625_9HYPH
MDKPQSGNRPLVPAPGEGKRGEDGYIGYLLRQAANAYETHLSRILRDLAVTPPQFSVMTMIAAYPGVSNADIARLTFLTPQTVSVIIGNLMKAGVVARRPHAIHGRIQQLELTESGKKLLDAAKARVKAVDAELIQDLSSADEKVLRRWLTSASSR